ncbi:hypothetical protein GWI33_018100 [Rhynchophorus ferrugineus]|uniref:Gustatory receptor n=1 Tax=Rhynchophorus ferrugineus TaxID=354439 RepID=A0A834HX09_RHYFE|nr:hypothetical protein GWI33_018100 [Rhynchophorus ferrugineus]
MKEITNRFHTLNKYLEELKELKCGDDDDIFNKPFVKKQHRMSIISDVLEDENEMTNRCPCEEVHKLRKCHVYLCEKVDEYNNIFGTIILLLLFVITVVWLDCTVFFASIYMLRTNSKPRLPVYDGLLYFILIGIFWIAGAVIQAIALASTGEKLLKETTKTSRISSALLTHLPLSKTPDVDHCYKKQLELLNQQSSFKKICVSAAGFFDVNNKMLGVMAANVSSYLLIILQFLTQKEDKNND